MSEQENDNEDSFLGRFKLKGERAIEKIVENVGFFGILLCASVRYRVHFNSPNTDTDSQSAI